MPNERHRRRHSGSRSRSHSRVRSHSRSHSSSRRSATTSNISSSSSQTVALLGQPALQRKKSATIHYKSDDEGRGDGEPSLDYDIPVIASSLDHTLPQEYFKHDLLQVIKSLRISKWHKMPISVANDIQLKRLSGALTNAIYKIDPPSVVILKNHDLHHIHFPSILLRIYGPNVDSIIDRNYELQILVRLSRKNIGARLLGIFNNGRLEQYLENAITLTKKDIMSLKTSARIARRMKELHVGINLTSKEREQGPSTLRYIRNWFNEINGWIAKGKLENFDHDEIIKTDFKTLQKTYKKYEQWILSKYEDINKNLVFCHNDTQYGNLLFSTSPKQHIEQIQLSLLSASTSSQDPSANLPNSIKSAKTTDTTDTTGTNGTNETNKTTATTATIDTTETTDTTDITDAADTAEIAETAEIAKMPSLTSKLSNLSLDTLTDKIKPTQQEKKQDQNLVVIDFEYAGPNVPAFDISNHFCEWMHNYNHPTRAYAVTVEDYPSIEEQLNLLYSYVLFPNDTSKDLAYLETMTKQLFNEVINWRPAVSLLWALWAILQNGPTTTDKKTEIYEKGLNGEQYKITIDNRDDSSDGELEEEQMGNSDVDNFQYLKFARDKLECYWGDLIQLKIINEEDVERLKNTDRFKYLNTTYFDV